MTVAHDQSSPLECFIHEGWAIYKNLLTKEGKVVIFGYLWDDFDQDYLVHIVKRYPDYFFSEELAVEPGVQMLKLKDAANGQIPLETLFDIAEGTPLEDIEVVDQETGRLLNPSRSGEESIAAS